MESMLNNKKISQNSLRMDVLPIFDRHDSATPLPTIESELIKYDRVTLYRTINNFLEKRNYL
jgi:hypothetical protein